MMQWDSALDQLQAQAELLGAAIYAERRQQEQELAPLPKGSAAAATDAAVAILNETQQYMSEVAKAILQETEADG